MRRFDARLSVLLTAFQLLAVLCVFAQPAYAYYVDPGSGLLAVQIISTTFAGMIFMLRRRLQALLQSAVTRYRFKGGKDAQ
jgi:hypothetical protein